MNTGMWPLHDILTNYVVTAIHGTAAVIIAVAAGEALFGSIVRRSTSAGIEETRLRLGRWLVLALEFELAADILRTAAAPSWTEIGQLASIVVLRTALNYALQRDINRAGIPPSLTPRGAVSSGTVPAEKVA